MIFPVWPSHSSRRSLLLASLRLSANCNKSLFLKPWLSYRDWSFRLRRLSAAAALSYNNFLLNFAFLVGVVVLATARSHSELQ